MRALAAIAMLLCSAHATADSPADAEARAILAIVRARQVSVTQTVAAVTRPANVLRNMYPQRSQSGRTWTGCGDWRHLTTGAHAGQFDPAWLRTLDAQQLAALHADAHEGRVQWPLVVRPARTPAAPSTSHARGYWTTERVCTKNGCTTRRVWRSH